MINFSITIKTQNSNFLTPKLTGLNTSLKEDIIAGFVVALMALPMSLGVAIASGFPPIAGIISAVTGGLVVTFFAGSVLTIKGPAGGLSAIMMATVIGLGSGDLQQGYLMTLSVVFFSGVIQIVLGMVRLGSFSDFFPASTIHGMLAALGFIMAVKQIHVALGVSPSGSTTWQLLQEIPQSINHMNPKIAIIGVISLAVMVLLSYAPSGPLKKTPSPLIVLLIVIPLGQYFMLSEEHIYYFGTANYTIIPQNILVQVPSNLMEGFNLPDFSGILRLDFWEYVLILSLAGTIETLLSTKAIDKVDPLKRTSNFNKDLFAVGIGNVVSGLCGGLPMISESKRSLININNGGKTEWSNFFHAVILVLIIVFLQPFVGLIPNAALAGMLIYTGARMTTPEEFSKSYKIGAEQFLVFIVTFLITAFSNFLWGISIGVITELLIHLRFGANLKALFNSNLNIKEVNESTTKVVFNGPATFSNFLGVKPIIESIPENHNVIFDFEKATIVDHTFMEHLRTFEEKRVEMGGQIEIAGLDYHKHLSNHPLAAKRIVKQLQLNERQEELTGFAETNNLSFDFRMVSNLSKFKDFTFSSGQNLKLEENRLKTVYKGYALEVSDILVEQGGQGVIRQDYKMTVLHITDTGSIVPDFTLQKEGFIDTLFAISGFDDIDFKDYPNFSFYYLLKGPKELQIRNFFNPELIKFFEQYKGYHLESKNGSIIIYKRPAILTILEIEALLEFSKRFLTIIKRNTNFE